MANPEPHRHLTDRDLDILLAIDRCPLTAVQLLKLSRTFAGQSFTSLRSVQDRLQKLRDAGWVRRWPYATASRGGSPDYYKTTLLGFHLLYGESAVPPSKRHFSEVSIANHHHTHSLAEFIVHTIAAAHRRGVRMAHFYRENSLRLRVGDETFSPDSAFELHTPAGMQLNFLVELDNGTERIRSDKDTESWQRKIRLYDRQQDISYPHRFRVLVVTTRSRDRFRSILTLAAEQTSNPRRSLFCGIHLDDFLAEADAVCRPCFQNHHGAPVAMVPAGVLGPPQASSTR